MNQQVLLRLATACLSLFLLCGPAAGAAPQDGDEPPAPVAPDNAPLPATDNDQDRSYSRLIRYRERDVVQVSAKVRYTTLIVLPAQEQILDYTCGDKEYWAVDGSDNFAYIKPAKTGSATNVNLVAASGNVYSFVLQEVSEIPGAEPDLKVFVEPVDETTLSALESAPRFVPAAQVEPLRRRTAAAEAQAQAAQIDAERLIERETNQFRAEYPTALRFDYRYRPRAKPFFVEAIYHDGRFSYIRATPEETPALYEIKDGKPNLVSFEYRDGTFVVSKVLDSGYLAIGKQKLPFRREE